MSELERVQLIKERLIKNENITNEGLKSDFAFLLGQIPLSLDEKQLILLNDTISVAILRVYKKNLHFISIDRLNSLFDHVQKYLDQSTSAMFSSLTTILKRLIDYLIKFEQSSQEILESWVDKLVESPTKSNFKHLETLLKSLHDKTYIPRTYQDFFTKSLKLMCDKDLANSIARVLVFQIQNGDDDWIPQILYALGDQNLKVPVSLQILPSLLKSKPENFTKLIENSSENTEILITLLKVGQDLQIIQNPYEKIPKQQFLSLLTHANVEHRIDSLILLLGSTAKHSKSWPVELIVYDFFQESHILDIFLNDYENVESRNKFVSVMNNFLSNRLKVSLITLSKSDSPESKVLIQGGKTFLKSFVTQLTLYLQPTANYSQIATSMELLHNILSDLAQFLAKTLRSGVLESLLLHNLLNDYENIRDWSLKILKIYPQLNIQEHMIQHLKRESDFACQDLVGRKSEGGAKAMEFLVYYYETHSLNVEDLVSSLISKIKDGIKRRTYIHGYLKALSSIDEMYFRSEIVTLIDLAKIAWDRNKTFLIDEKITESAEFDNKEEMTCSWKVVKETNSLVTVLLRMPVIFDDTFLECSNRMIEQISLIKHKGVVQDIYLSFVEVCQACLALKSLSKFPEIWLQQNLQLMLTKTQAISRRSGGLPYLITGILAALKNRIDLVDSTILKLIEVAQESSEHYADQKNDIPQVHAFNCLKQLFMDSEFSNISDKYVKVCLELSFDNFNAKNWSVRNCAVMLFGSIELRLFKNLKKYPAHLFFGKYKGLNKTFNALLQQDSKCRNSNPIVFPISIIVGKLDFSGSDEIKNELWPVISTYLASEDYKVREIVGRSIVTMLSPADLILMSTTIFNQDFKTNNYIHGYLITILESIKRFEDSQENHLRLFLSNIEVYSKNSFLFNYCIKIIHELSDRLSYTIDSKILDFLGNSLISYSDLPGGEAQLLICSIFELLILQNKKLQNTCSVDLINFCLSLNYKVQICVLELLLTLPTNIWQSCHEAIWHLIKSEETWSYVKTLALEAYNQILLRVPLDSTKASILISLSENENQKLALTALKCLGGFEKGRKDLVSKCLKNCEDGMPYENREAAITCLERIALDEELSPSDVDEGTKAIAIMTLYVYGLNDEDEGLRMRSSKFFSKLFQLDYDASSTYLQYKGIELLSKWRYSLKKAIETIILRQIKPFEAKLKSIYGLERDNLYKNELIIAQSLLKLYIEWHGSIDAQEWVKLVVKLGIHDPTDFRDEFMITTAVKVAAYNKVILGRNN